MDEVSRVIRYMFILAVILMILAYNAGAIGLGKTLFAGANQLDLTATGRDAQGNFAGYPK